MNICRRCRRPLEGDESYICCAGMELRWRCTECQKVSEGFAFPYGLCPYCKGKLELMDRGAIGAYLAGGKRKFAYFRDLDGNKLAVFHTGR